MIPSALPKLETFPLRIFQALGIVAPVSEINPNEMIQWFRAKATEFNGIADSLERTFSPSGAPNVGSPIGVHRPTRERKTVTVAPPTEEASVETIMRAVSAKSYRANALAARFGCSEDKILDLVESEGSGLIVAPRGWIKPAESLEGFEV